MSIDTRACLTPGAARQTVADRRGVRRVVGALLACSVLLTAATLAHAADPQPQAQPSAGGPPRVPMVSTQGPPTHVEGKIARSTRGSGKGPVRLDVEPKKGGEPVKVMVAEDAVCDRLGLSLKAGEEVAVDGPMLKGERPILIATAFTVDGKTIRVRDESGKVVDPSAAAGGDKAPAGGAPGGGAVMGGGKPAASPKP